ncbi:hypothetical protein GPECTOR_214g441 [Gonium pectorale]|uniref:Uncharacterized protein n=1 Tax=Gonium pectorale TaxID=33097 RepID=A0A150FWT1_GONPE|nr:hypothetical protein GPECTOR_214g441 [Gonium pectorale]|eukprot:KXZ42059.1 hypothetical protein GPECTOR_214g441 [Gonium pectorale]
MYACYADAPDVAQELLVQGADPWITDRCGCRNALHYAAMSGSTSCVEVLMKHTPHSLLTREGIRYINARSLSGLTPLHYAVYFGHEEAVKELMNHEPNINAASTSEAYDVTTLLDTYSTPLHFAAFKDNVPAARQLLLFYVSGQQRARRRHTGTLLDPRLRRNSAGKFPCQVALSAGMANLLRPGRQLAEVLSSLGETVQLDEQVGPPNLAAIAAAALRQKLLAAVEVIEREVVADDEMQLQQGARTNSLLCGAPRNGTRSGLRHISRSISRNLSRIGSVRSARTSAPLPLPVSPSRAPTLDRVAALAYTPDSVQGGESVYSIAPSQPMQVAPGMLPGRIVTNYVRIVPI